MSKIFTVEEIRKAKQNAAVLIEEAAASRKKLPQYAQHNFKDMAAIIESLLGNMMDTLERDATCDALGELIALRARTKSKILAKIGAPGVDDEQRKKARTQYGEFLLVDEILSEVLGRGEYSRRMADALAGDGHSLVPGRG